MSRKFKQYNVNEPYLLPPDLNDWLPARHLARVIHLVVNQLNLEAFEIAYRDGGRPAHDPRMMLKITLYGYCTGRFSSRKIEKATYDDLGMRFLSADQHPDHDCIAAFRARHATDVRTVFRQVCEIASRMGLVSLGHVAIDGTKIPANASREKTLTREQLEQRIQGLLDKAKAADQEEKDAPEEIPEDLSSEAALLERLQQALARLNKENQERDAAAKAEYQERLAKRNAKQAANENQVCEPADGKFPLKSLREQRGLTQTGLAALTGIQRSRLSDLENLRRPPSQSELLALAEALGCEVGQILVRLPKQILGRAPQLKETLVERINLTDPDSAIMKRNIHSSFIQGYNPQLAVDDKAGVIVGAEVTNNATDRHNLLPMADLVKDNMGRYPGRATADTGYCSKSNIQGARERGINLLTPPERVPKTPANPDPDIQAMREELRKPETRALYDKRSGTVEPAIGNIKCNLGFMRFLTRGIRKVNAEWLLVATAHNLGKLFRAGYLIR